MNQVVFSGTQIKYTNHNVGLILWVCDKDKWREVVITHWMVESLITAKAEGKKAIHDTYKSDLSAINRIDDNCPILLEK